MLHHFNFAEVPLEMPPRPLMGSVNPLAAALFLSFLNFYFYYIHSMLEVLVGVVIIGGIVLITNSD